MEKSKAITNNEQRINAPLTGRCLLCEKDLMNIRRHLKIYHRTLWDSSVELKNTKYYLTDSKLKEIFTRFKETYTFMEIALADCIDRIMDSAIRGIIKNDPIIVKYITRRFQKSGNSNTNMRNIRADAIRLAQLVLRSSKHWNKEHRDSGENMLQLETLMTPSNEKLLIDTIEEMQEEICGNDRTKRRYTFYFQCIKLVSDTRQQQEMSKRLKRYLYKNKPTTSEESQNHQRERPTSRKRKQSPESVPDDSVGHCDKRAYQNLDDNMDDFSSSEDPKEQLPNTFEDEKFVVDDTETAKGQLDDVQDEAQSEIHSKSAIIREENNLQKKRAHRIDEIENDLYKELKPACIKTLQWLGDGLENISSTLFVSANKEILQKQHRDHEQMYRAIMAKECQVIMLLKYLKEFSLLCQKTQSSALQQDSDQIQSDWDRLKKIIMDRQTKLHICIEHCVKYCTAQDSFLPWLTKSEDEFDKLKSASFSQLEDASFRNEVQKHSDEFSMNIMLAEIFLSACDVDKDEIKRELSAMKIRWSKLQKDLSECIRQPLNDSVCHQLDFSHALECGTHDALGDLSKDTKLLDGITKPIEEITITHPENHAKEQELETIDLRTEITELNDRIEHITAFISNLSALENELRSIRFDAPGYDTTTVEAQIQKVTKLIININCTVETVNDQVTGTEDKSTAAVIANVRAKCQKFSEHDYNIKKTLHTRLEKLQEFYQIYDDVIHQMNDASVFLQEHEHTESVVDFTEARNKNFKIFEAIGPIVTKCYILGRCLTQGIDEDILTGDRCRIGKDLKDMEEMWSNLKERTKKFDHRLDIDYQFGNYQNASEDFEKSLKNTEQITENQQLPSANCQVVVAQLQGQKIMKQMLSEHQKSMSALNNMACKVMTGVRVEKEETIVKKMADLNERLKNLLKAADEREKALKRAIFIEELIQKVDFVTDWLDEIERKIEDMKSLTVQELVAEYNRLKNTFASMDFSDYKRDTTNKLIHLDGTDKATLIADKLQDTTGRYAELMEKFKALETSVHEHQYDEVMQNMDNSINWFKNVISQLRKAQKARSSVAAKIKKHKNINEGVTRQNEKAEDVISTSLKLIEDSNTHKHMTIIKSKTAELREMMERTCLLSAEHLQELENQLYKKTRNQIERLLDRQDYNSALEQLRKTDLSALSDRKIKAKLLYMKGKVLRSLKKYPNAVDVLLNTICLDGETESYINTLVEYLISLGFYQTARAVFCKFKDKAIDISDKYEETFGVHGELHPTAQRERSIRKLLLAMNNTANGRNGAIKLLRDLRAAFHPDQVDEAPLFKQSISLVLGQEVARMEEYLKSN